MEWKYSIYEYVQDYISVSFVEKKNNCGAEECAMSCIDNCCSVDAMKIKFYH